MVYSFPFSIYAINLRKWVVVILKSRVDIATCVEFFSCSWVHALYAFRSKRDNPLFTLYVVDTYTLRLNEGALEVIGPQVIAY